MADAQSGTDRRGPSQELRSKTRTGDGHHCLGHFPTSEPRSFGPPLVAVEGMSALPVKASLAIGEAGVELVTRQALAVTDYWQAVSAARAPWDVLAANSDYWTHFCRNVLAATDDIVQKGGPRASPNELAERGHA